MDTPPYIISTTLFLCERSLLEVDGVLSAIRIVDVARAAEPTSETEADRVQLNVFAVVKATLGYLEEHLMEITLQNALGERTRIVGDQMRFTSRLEGAPPAVSFNIQLNLAVRNFGVCYVL